MPWVLLRGLTRDQRHWGAFASDFAAAFTNAPVITLDLPGNGALNAMRSPGRVDAMAAFCRNELRERGVAPPYRILAMSLGAMVATAWAHEHPNEIAGAVLINTSLRPFSPVHRRLKPSRALLRLLLSRHDRFASERAVIALTSNTPRQDDDTLARRWAAYRSERPVSAANTLRQLWAASRFAAPPTSPFSPPFARVLLLTSERDVLVDTRCSLALAQAWQCELESHPWAGHDLPLDDPTWVIDAVRRRFA
jgi:pimeloyl-ACP methyl ester carboxylesterase